MKPIGVFDSGVGGLTVVRALRRRLPHESILYLGDTARLPYGTKSPQTVRQYTRRNVEFLEQRGVKAVVVACNTARPGARRLADAGAGVGRGRAWRRARGADFRRPRRGDRHRGHHPLRRLRPRAAPLAARARGAFSRLPLFVPLVEEVGTTTGGRGSGAALPRAAARRRIDTLVLGCTHYPLLEPVLRRLAGDACSSSIRRRRSPSAPPATSRRPATAAAGERREDHFCVTDAADRFARLARLILGTERVSLELVEV
jgi:glutamate racemase